MQCRHNHLRCRVQYEHSNTALSSLRYARRFALLEWGCGREFSSGMYGLRRCNTRMTMRMTLERNVFLTIFVRLSRDSKRLRQAVRRSSQFRWKQTKTSPIIISPVCATACIHSSGGGRHRSDHIPVPSTYDDARVQTMYTISCGASGADRNNGAWGFFVRES